MIHPDDESKPLVSRWTSLVRILLVESSVKLVARNAFDFADFYDTERGEAGSNTYPGNELLARETGLSERTVRTAWATVRGLGLAERTEMAAYDPLTKRRTADAYRLAIPEDWKRFPVLGPSRAKFRCLYCGHLMNPRANSKINAKGEVTFRVAHFCFCPEPRDLAKRPGCFKRWERAQKVSDPWGKVDVWEKFREARGEEWPETA